MTQSGSVPGMSESAVATVAVDPDPRRDLGLRRPVLIGSLALLTGVAVDVLAWGRPVGLGLALVLVAMAGVVAFAIEANDRATPRSRVLTGLALVLGSLPAFRAAPVVVVLAVGTWLTVLAVLTASTRDEGLRTWTLVRYFVAGFDWLLAVGDGLTVVVRDFVVGETSLRRLRGSFPVVRGVALATGAVLFFGLLFVSADPIFGNVISEAFDVDFSFGRSFRLVFVSSAVAIVVLGMGRRAVRRATSVPSFVFAGRGVTEAVFVIAAVDLLFAGFLIVQFRYLFGGTVARIELGFAEYARRGFFELVFVAFCVLGLILVTDWIVQQRRRHLDVLHVVLVAETFVVMISALVRMDAYTDAFGLSELRLYTTIFMVWVAVLLGVLIVTVLRSNRSGFAFAAFATGVAAVLIVSLMNPHALIARHNIERAIEGAPLDLDYLDALSADADPALVTGLTALATLDADTVEARIESSTTIERYLDERVARLEERAADNGWRSWSWAHTRAIIALRSSAG